MGLLVASGAWRRWGGGALRVGIDAVLPPQCLACDTPVDIIGRLCAECWVRVPFIGAPLCVRCGLPFEIATDVKALCGACARRPPAFDRARAAFVYDGVGRDLVLAFKLADRTRLAPALAAWLGRAAAPLLPEADLIAPVPLHRWRLFARRFNQSAMLAGLLARDAGAPLVPDLLVRTRRTRSQANLSAAARRRNVGGAFSLRAGRAARVVGKRVLLVDDVLTSGATASACATVLRRGGAAGVDVVTLARTPSGRA